MIVSYSIIAATVSIAAKSTSDYCSSLIRSTWSLMCYYLPGNSGEMGWGIGIVVARIQQFLQVIQDLHNLLQHASSDRGVQGVHWHLQAAESSS